MIEGMLQLFVSEQKAEAILANSMIELIFTVLFVTFIISILVHVLTFNKLKKIRNYLKETNRMDIDPLRYFKEQYDQKRQEEAVKVETFVQDKFSSWRIFNVPVVSLIKMIQSTVSIFILIGVLGTFIGLTMSLSNIDLGGDQIVENVASVLSGIDVAFYTSIAGMAFSLIMTVVIKTLNTEYLLTDIMLKVESNLDEAKQDGMKRLIEVSETINNSIIKLQETNQQSLQGIEHAFQGFQDYTDGLQQSAEDLAKFNEGLSTNLQDFQVIFDNMKEVTEGFDKGTKTLNKNFDQLFSYFKKMDGRNERMAATFESVYEKIEQVSTTQMDTLHQFESSIDDLKNFTMTIVDGQDSVKASLEKINRKSNDLVDQMAAHNKEFKQIFGTDLSVKLEGITAYLGELSREFDKLGESIVDLPGAIEMINQTQTQYKHLLTDRFDELKQFNKEFNNHLKSHSADSVAFEKHLLEATNTYEQVGVKNNQLINEINATIAQMNQSFNQRENQLEANVGVLKDTLSRYVSNLEGTLGDKLDKVVRNIGDYVELTNEGIKKEFKELRLINEEIQQSSNRYAQQTFNELNQEIHKLNQNLSNFNQEAKLSSSVRLSGND